MKLRVIQTTETEGFDPERLEIEVTLEQGERFPLGLGNIVVCSDGVVFTYQGKREHLVEVSPGKFEPMLLFDSVSLSEPTRVEFKKGQTITFVFSEMKEGTIVKQVISRL